MGACTRIDGYSRVYQMSRSVWGIDVVRALEKETTWFSEPRPIRFGWKLLLQWKRQSDSSPENATSNDPAGWQRSW